MVEFNVVANLYNVVMIVKIGFLYDLILYLSIYIMCTDSHLPLVGEYISFIWET